MANLSTKMRGVTDFGFPAAPAGYIAEAYTTGVADGTPFAYGSLGTLIKADQANAIPAVGFVYSVDPIPVGTAYSDNPVAYALPRSLGGKILDEEKKGIVTIQENTLRFRKVQAVVNAANGSGTGSSNTYVVAGVDLTSELKVGDFITISQSAKTSTTTQVSAISFSTNTTITTRDALADTYTASTTTALSMMGRRVYLGDTSGTSKFSKLAIPYSTLVPASGEWGQEVGYVYSACELMLDFTKDPSGKTY